MTSGVFTSVETAVCGSMTLVGPMGLLLPACIELLVSAASAANMA